MEGKSQGSTDLSSDIDSQNITCFYFPTSFSSQKVLLALYEKNVQFKPKLVSLFHGQHMEPWYVRLNPDGVHVPVLKDGAKIINNPEEIIDYIDMMSDTGPTLVPDLKTSLGQSVASVREQLTGIPVDVITYGIIFHPHLSASGCRLPFAVQRSMRENFAKRLCYLTHKATRHPSLRDGYLAKSQTAAQKYDIITDEEKVKGQLDQLDNIFSDIEILLRRTKEGSDDSGELWLFGKMITAADISLTILLSRLSLLGMEARYFPAKTCPNIHKYYQLFQKRSTFRRIQYEINDLRWTLVVEDLKAAAPYMLGAAGVLIAAGLVAWLVKTIQK
ncbi:ganglioside-induced differentiation-associated protein 1-like [Haliotis cracherodii]|uniref:ganglioside-induced differentiation-associated protein 1-like n=1 Tax=Haliotis rufescens TaxID=6454 RepID=UPI001EB05D78|nr:ganglioside-induced differentiation-associated protein 1-like [Haliotis rufescens]